MQTPSLTTQRSIAPLRSLVSSSLPRPDPSHKVLPCEVEPVTPAPHLKGGIMGRVKEQLLLKMENEEIDFLRMQTDSAQTALSSLKEMLEYLAWRMQFYGEGVDLDDLAQLREEVRYVKRILT